MRSGVSALEVSCEGGEPGVEVLGERGSQNRIERSHEPVMSVLVEGEKTMEEMESACVPRWVIFSVERSSLEGRISLPLSSALSKRK